MTPLELGLLFAIAALVYQEVSWRDKARRIQADYEKRISTEVAMAYETSLAGDETARARPYVPSREAGAARAVPRGDSPPVHRRSPWPATAVKYAAGDLNEIERFSIPPEIKRALLEFVSPARQMAIGAGR